MEDEPKAIIIRPIGHIENGFESAVPEGYEDIPSDIILRQELSEAVDGI